MQFKTSQSYPKRSGSSIFLMESLQAKLLSQSYPKRSGSSMFFSEKLRNKIVAVLPKKEGVIYYIRLPYD